MIELGSFDLSTSETFDESRRKMLRLAAALGFGEIDAARLASVFSELGRPKPDGQGPLASVGVKRAERGPCLALALTGVARDLNQGCAARFFDSVGELGTCGDGSSYLALKYLPDPAFVLSAAFLDAQREMLARPSRAELLLALRQKNDALEREVTERRLTEEALRRSEARIQAVLEGTPDCLLIAGQDGRIAFVNSQTERTFGYGREELLGRPLEMLVPEEDRAGHPARVASFFKQGRTMEMGIDRNLYALAKDGTRVAVDLKLSVLHTEAGMQVIASIRDVSEQKKALEAVKQLSLVVEQSPASVAITDRQGLIEYVNPAFCQSTGYTPEELLGQSPSLLKSGRTPDGVHRELWETIVSGRIWRGLLINRKKNGEDFWESTAIAPIFNQKGEITHFAAVKEDITERIRGEEELKRQRALLDTLINALPLVIYSKDADGAYQVANESLAQLTGLPRQEIIGKSAADIFPPETAGTIAAADQKTLTEMGPSSEESWRVYPDGRKALFHMTRVPLVDDLGRATGLVGAFTDITALKKAQDGLRDALDVISGSIRYASRIQRAVLPPSEDFAKAFSSHFIIWKPRDVVGGDIYWSARWGRGQLFALGDCTGHGVPGAFMTLISTGALARAVSEVEPGRPGLLLRRAHQIVQTSLNQHLDTGDSDDGMEIGLCYLERGAAEMVFVGARFPLFVDAGDEIVEMKADRKGIGYRGIPFEPEFTEHRIALRRGLRMYLVSDGVFDQVGGEKKRGFGKKRFKELLLSMAGLPLEEQGQRLYGALREYQGDEARRDDVSIMGLEY